MEYLTEYVTGGLGRLVNKGIAFTRDKAEGVETDPKDVPVVSAFVNQSSQFDESGRFYDVMKQQSDDGKQRLSDAKNAFENRHRDNWADVEELAHELGAKVEKGKNIQWKPRKGTPGADDPMQWSWPAIIDAAGREMRELRTQMYSIDTDPSLPRAEREKLIRDLEGQIELIQRETRDTVNRRRALIVVP
jgi:hypothetical protein